MDEDYVNQIFRQWNTQRIDGKPFVDVEIEVQNQKFFAHKLILLSNSDYFKSIFAAMDKKEKSLKLGPDIKSNDFLLLLDYMYGNKVDMKEMEMTEILSAYKLAELFGLEVFTEECNKYAKGWSESNNIGDMYSLLCALKNDEDMEKAELSVLRHFNFETTESLPVLIKISPELMVASLRREDIKEEMSIETLNKRLGVIFEWMKIRDLGTFDDLTATSNQSPDLHSTLKEIHKYVLKWHGAAQRNFRN